MKKTYALTAFMVLFVAGCLALVFDRPAGTTPAPSTAAAASAAKPADSCCAADGAQPVEGAQAASHPKADNMDACPMGGNKAMAASAVSNVPMTCPVTGARAFTIACPVTGEKIASREKAAGKSVYQGKTYYFCCPSCKPKFDKDPAKYVHPQA